MSTSLWTAFYDYVLPDVPGVAQALASRALCDAAIEFCEKTCLWIYDCDPWSAVANINTYDWAPPANSLVVKPLQIWYQTNVPQSPGQYPGWRLVPKTPDELSDLYGDWERMYGEPLYYTHTTPRSVIFVPGPLIAYPNAFRAKVALKPTRAATGIDNLFLEEYAEALANGAKAKLFAMKKKPWSDGSLAEYHRQEFMDAIAMATDRAQKGFTRARKRVKASYF